MLLTDEELAALGADCALVVEPFLAALSADEREAATRAAARSLCLRGLVRLDDSSARIRPALQRLLDVRTGAELVVCARREATPERRGGASTTAPGAELRYWHRLGGRVVEETVDADGLHRLSPGGAGDLTERVAAFLQPGRPNEQALGDAGERAAAATWVADVVVRRPGDEGAAPLLSVLTGPAGTAVVRSASPAEAAGGSSPPVVRPSDRAGVTAAVADLLDLGAGGARERQWHGE